jgi:hypothetical protein
MGGKKVTIHFLLPVEAFCCLVIKGRPLGAQPEGAGEPSTQGSGKDQMRSFGIGTGAASEQKCAS